MTLILDWLSGPTAESLCFALLHSLWQGAAWCALLLFLLRRIPGARPQARYAVSLTCLYGLLAGACVTWSILRQPATPADVPAPSLASVVDIGRSPDIEAGLPPAPPPESIAAPKDLAGASPTHMLAIASLAPWIVAVWMVGASVCLHCPPGTWLRCDAFDRVWRSMIRRCSRYFRSWFRVSISHNPFNC